MAFFKKLVSGVSGVLGKGVGLLAKGGQSLVKTLLGTGDDKDTQAAKASAQTIQSLQALAAVQKAQAEAKKNESAEQKKIADRALAYVRQQQQKGQPVDAGLLAAAAQQFNAVGKAGKSSQTGIASRLRLALVWEWLQEKWYVPTIVIVGLIMYVYYRGSTRKKKRR